MKIEFKNSIRRFSFLPSTGHENCLDKILEKGVGKKGRGQ